MVLPTGSPEGEIARQVLTIVTHHRLEGLARENRRLPTENDRLLVQLSESSGASIELEHQVLDLQLTISQLVQTNGANGISRPDLRANRLVCALCFDHVGSGGPQVYCDCQEYVCCSRECQGLHWSRHHKCSCPAWTGVRPERPLE